MKSAIKYALFAAIPVEVANLLFASFPMDTGFPVDANWGEQLVGYQWLYLHYPGLLLLFRLNFMGGFEKLLFAWPNWTGFGIFGLFVLFVSGYLDTVLLIVTVIFGLRWFCHLTGKYSARRDPSTTR